MAKKLHMLGMFISVLPQYFLSPFLKAEDLRLRPHLGVLVGHDEVGALELIPVGIRTTENSKPY